MLLKETKTSFSFKLGCRIINMKAMGNFFYLPRYTDIYIIELHSVLFCQRLAHRFCLLLERD